VRASSLGGVILLKEYRTAVTVKIDVRQVDLP
jgi:hypothetical protein